MAARRGAANRHASPVESERPGASKRTRPTPAARTPAATRAVNLDRLIHDRTRLAIISALAASSPLTFTELKQLLDLSDGNLSVHARKLEEAEYVVCQKTFEGRVPRTEYRLTPAGRRALEKYVSHMEAILRAVKD